jgi:hypothetical protein
MRYSLRRALSLDSVDGGTHNPTILFLHHSKHVCIRQTTTVSFIAPAQTDRVVHLFCSVRFPNQAGRPDLCFGDVGGLAG